MRILYCICLLVSPYLLFAQIGISNTAPNNNPNHLINNILVGGGVTISNISLSALKYYAISIKI